MSGSAGWKRPLPQHQHYGRLVLCLQIVSKDKDFRYMAASDLVAELQKDSFRVRCTLRPWSNGSKTPAMLQQEVLSRCDAAAGMGGMAGESRIRCCCLGCLTGARGLRAPPRQCFAEPAGGCIRRHWQLGSQLVSGSGGKPPAAQVHGLLARPGQPWLAPWHPGTQAARSLKPRACMCACKHVLPAGACASCTA